jgi:integrase/recombinase XerD
VPSRPPANSPRVQLRRRRVKRHPGTIEVRGDSLRVILHVDRKRHAFTLKTADLREAEEFARRKQQELKRESARWQRRGLAPARVSTLFDRFEAERLPLKALNTQATYRASLASFRKFFVDSLGDPLVHEIESDAVADFLAWRRRQRQPHGRVPKREREQPRDRTLRKPVSNRTLAKDRTTLHAIFAFAEELRLRDGNPVARVDSPKADPRTPVILTEEQLEKLRAQIAMVSPMHELYVVLLAETGGRCDSEALWLRWEDVDLDGGFLAIVSGRGGNRTKSGKTRYVPMTARLKQAMAAHVLRFKNATYDGKPSPWVFHHLTTRRHAVAGERIRSLYDAFKNAAGQAGLPLELHQHDLRHRRVTTWLAQGKDVVLVKEAMGHADLRTTMGYTHLAKEHLRALVEERQIKYQARPARGMRLQKLS